jgi:predicted nucleic acid-binding protein
LILVDTSVWIDHFRSQDSDLRNALNHGQVVIHPWVIAELALGFLRERTKILVMLDLLPQVHVARMSELRATIEMRRLYGLGIGLTDAHLIAAALLNPPTVLWTRDKRLRQVAEAFRIHAALP